MTNHKECPHCKSTIGYYQTSIRSSDLFFDFDGNGDGESEGYYIRENKIVHCRTCNKGFRLEKKQ